MNFASSIATDLAHLDSMGPVTLRQARANGLAERLCAFALAAPVARAARPHAGVALVGDEQVWSLDAAEVGPDGVEPGDEIIEASGLVWKVAGAELAALRTRWRCACRRPVAS